MFLRSLFCWASLCCSAAAQISSPPARIPAGEAIDIATKNNALTAQGSPFHAVLEIRPEKMTEPAFTGRVELFWKAEQQYRLVVSSPSFAQTLIVDGAEVSETDRGDFYPGWISNFVTALLDPMPRAASLRGRGEVAVGRQASFSCVKRDDRPGGITDQMTWAQVCFSGEQPRLQFAIDFTYNMEFDDFQPFGTKSIAHSYLAGTGNFDHLRGTLITLEPWSPDDSLLTVSVPTRPVGRLLTKFVSTQTEESMLESAPKDVAWPTVLEGKTDGFMIIQAITDRTGQVRETSKHNSDNAELESFGREVALKYKFRPLVVDGAPVQMIMPLVLHFNTKIGTPFPELDDAASRKMISGCSLPREIKMPGAAGEPLLLQFEVSEQGHLNTIHSLRGGLPMELIQNARGCRFALYKENRVPAAYHANITINRRK